jgi:hypothetical protein
MNYQNIIILSVQHNYIFLGWLVQEEEVNM